MSIKVHLYSSLRNQAKGRDIVEVRGSTVGECLKDLVAQYPDIRPVLFDEQGKLSKNTFVSINLESAYREQLANPVKNEDELYIILIIAGG
jgi:molybdopterin converting factor small subunit